MTSRPEATRPVSEMLARRSECRACAGTRLLKFLPLGDLPLANSYLTAEQLNDPEPRFPLEVYFCEDCSLVQLLDVVDPEILFGNYLYRTGTNQTIVRHNAALAEAVVRKLGLGGASLVVEIASNDGSLLAAFRERGTRTLGVEPARNIAQIARDAGIETISEFFDGGVAQNILRTHGAASAVLANNVLAHVDQTVPFLSACRALLAPGGRVVIEAPYLGEMVHRLEYDTVYHEHLCYYSVTALMRMFESAGLALDDVELVEIHGGSLRLWARALDSRGHGESARRMATEEALQGLTRAATYREFAARVARNREQLRALLARLRAEGKRIAAYGAAAKGNTLLCYCGIGRETLEFVADRSTLKVGLFLPGSRVPIVPVEKILETQPDYVLILAWNFAPEIFASLEAYRAKGGKCILPIPEPTVV